MSKVGYSCTVRLFLLLFQTVWLHISIAKAELTFLGQEPFRAYASQGSLTGVSLYQFFVIDTQSQNDQVEVSFSIEQTNLPFVLTPSSGELLVTGDLIEEVYTFTVQAVSSSATILTNITVNVVSISDTSPRFEHAQYNLEVSEALQTDSPLGVVRAFSLNPGTMSQRYSIVAGNTDSDISITSNTGLLRVGRRLDRERTELYQLTIRYVDDVASVDATVSLSVLDVNDESPQFSMPLYSVVIPETVSVGTVVLAVNASDRDIGVNARVTYSLEPSVSEVFSLNTEDGVLRTAALLDYERQLRYQFRVTATDGGNPSLSSVATVLINLENIDDECPRFENPVFIEELPYDIAGTPPSVGTEILTVVATDPDRFSDVSYSIVSGQTEVLELDSLTGVITLASTGSGDPRGQYMLNVSASDASCIGQSFARVEIGIGNVNDHSPQFVTECVASLSENPPRGTEVVTLRATDLDIGFNGLVTYSVSSTERFQIESTSGVVRTTAEPSLYDREDRSTYQVGVTASDGGGRQDYCLLTITLLDENDNPPQIPLSSYTTSLSRSSIRGTFVLQITAQDQDVGDNGRIVYSISSSSLLPFQISNVSGVITTSDTLPSDDSFTFTVVAADLGTTIQLTSSALVTITLTDSDSLPRFSEMNYTGSVCENAVAGTTVLTVNVSNPSPTDFIQFDILEGSDYHSNLDRTFSIREDTTFFNLATIIVGSQSIVDFERLHPNPNFQFFVSATNIHGSSIVPVEIFVMDIDDNPPEFSTNIFISIAENEPVGTTVATVQATDLDSGANGEIRYRFRAGQTQSYFNITSDGTITSNQMFDYETSENTAGTLIVEAYNPNSEPSSSVCVSFPQGVDTNLIQWSIIDQNDNPPSFLASSYIIDVPENTSLLTRVFMLNATDRDISDLGRLSFSILSGNDGNFGIDSNFIVLTGRLDFETTPTYDLQIQVTDGSFSNSNCLQCTTTVCIQVTNTDDESPVFLSPEYHATVVENSQIGTSVLTISATDVDSPSIEYELAGLAEGRFSVNKSGVVFVSGNIDREEFPGGSLVFLAFAEGGSLATANIFIDIDDENDYEPRFSTVFRGSVVENQLPGDEGIYASEVRAVDLDRGENGTVSYSLISGEESGFRIDLQTGVISAHAEFDREAVSSYLLTVEARDNGSSVQLSSQTQVVIEIGDVDDNPASFPFPYMFSRLYENPPLGHSVIFLPAVDPDTSADSALVFALSDTHPPEPKFAVNSSTGEITVTGSLDYEIPLHRLYTLTVSVMDPDYPQTSSGTLQIQLLDRNDNAPEITISQPQSNLQETHPLGAQVAMVTASDGDSGNNLELIFALTDGNSNDDFELVIENGEGIIRSAHQFDYETTSIYVLTVTVSDRGNPPMSSSVPLEFNIIDVNDESPVFTQSVYSVSIQENSSPMNNLIQVMASDRDTGIGGEIAGYEIVEGNEKGRFILSSSGVLASLVMFDREEQSEYTLTVAAYDRGAEPQRGIAEICVTITDVSDSLSLSGGHLTVLIYALDGLAPRGDIAPLYFIDPDSDDTFTDCIVRAQDHVEIFSIDASTCIVRLDVSNPEEGVYNYLTVDGRVRGPNVAVEASATITVKHIDSSLISVDNLVTVTIDASFEAYINEPLSTSLPSQLAIVLEISEEDLRIITVQRGAFLPDSTVDISFTATSGDGTLFLSTEILHQLFLRRESLDIDGHTLLNLPLDACASEPCQNQAGCRTVWSVSPTEKVISTQQFVFFAPRIDFSYECLCSPGTTGEHCETNFDDCYSNPCQHGAACTDLINGFSCDCPEGYSGVDCSVPPPDCSTNVCQNGATCTVVNGDTSCKCHPGYYGPLCQYHYFIPSSFCSHDNNPCQNGADCSPGRDSFTCVCLPGFLGEFCENPTLLQGGCIDNPCYNGSTCEETPTGPTCICSIGFTGPNCRWPLNSCELEPCLNGGTCDRGLYNSHVCICPQGFTGEDCSFRTPSCLSDPCVNGGRCVDGVDGTYTCECLHGYSGPMCEFTVQPEEDLCDMEFCSDNGNCTSGRDNFTCSCDAGFSGKDCSVADDMEDMPCARNPCLHGGSCKSNSSLPGGFRCKCSPGFTGPGCENNINECTDHPCMNGGTCENGLGGYVCTCPEGMGGYDCQVHCPEGLSGQFCQTLLHPCRENLCQNSGTCTEERGVFSCSCPPAHTGNRCEVNVSCSQSSCRNGGTCVQSLGGGVECECTSDFSGENCELLTVSFSGSKTESSYRAFRSLDIRGHGRIEFEFATTDRDGLLMYNTQLQNGRSEDYIAVEVVGGALRVSISHGSGDSSVSVMNSLLGVSDGDWHQVVIETAQKEFQVSLDECLLIPKTLLPSATCVTMEVTPGARSFLDLGLPLWVGGVPFSLPANSTRVSSQGVTGCIRGVRIDGEILDLEGYVFERNSQRGCSHLESQICLQNSSACGSGSCVPVFDGYVCDCPQRTEGGACERAAQSIMYRGATYAAYSLHGYQFSSVSKRQSSDVSLRSTTSDRISLWFRTEMESGRGLLLYMGSEETSDELYLQLEDGSLNLHINLGSQEEQLCLSSTMVTDSDWHYVEIVRLALDLTITVDNVTFQHTLPGTQLSLDVTPVIYTGGRPNLEGNITLAPYIGCLQDIRIDRTPLPTSGSNNFTRVEFFGDSDTLYNCALGECLRRPCGRGNCTERENNNFECACEVGVRTISRRCPSELTPPMFTLVIVFVAVVGSLLILVVLAVMGLLCCKYLRGRGQKLDLSSSHDNENGVDLFGRQCLVISNEAGGGEVDTHIGVDEISSALFTNRGAIQEEKEEVGGARGSDEGDRNSEGFSVQPLSKIIRANSPPIDKFIQEKLDGISKDYRDVDSLCEFEDEGSDSETGSLSSICSSSAESVYTIEKLRQAGPEFEPFIDLLTCLLEEEEEQIDGGSQQAHTGNTQLTQGLTPLSQDLW